MYVCLSSQTFMYVCMYVCFVCMYARAKHVCMYVCMFEALLRVCMPENPKYVYVCMSDTPRQACMSETSGRVCMYVSNPENFYVSEGLKFLTKTIQI